MNDNGWRGGKRDNNDGPPDLDEIFRSLNQKLSRLLGGRGGQGDGQQERGGAAARGLRAASAGAVGGGEHGD